ncbi:MAG TPA: sugar transferase [Pyrinomonadaceae bacterium]|nr:sugar transferase [Pyrinomonadaceae bacterium]
MPVLHSTESSESLPSPSALAHSSIGDLIKRGLDVTLALVLLVSLAPLLFMIAVLIWLHDGGPVLYRRRVVGRTADFDAFKFRTMRVDADAVLASNPEIRREFEQNFKLKKDPRVTRVGAVLRKYSLDELPQLLNVLRGQMSLVGPRMITVAELPKYGEFESLLRSVRPGLTGYWQVNGRQTVGYEERVRMDVYYVQNWSLALDVKILLRTPWKILRGEGAY